MASEEVEKKDGGSNEKTQSATAEKTKSESIKLIGGLVALGSGLLVLGLIAGGALSVGTATAEKIAIGAFGVIGTLVGAYFGQKIGSDGTKDATERADKEATKAQIYAAHLPEGEASEIVRLAHRAATGEDLPLPAPPPTSPPPPTTGRPPEAAAGD